MASNDSERPELDFLPYLTSTNSKTGKDLRILIDSGSNKNFIKPGILKHTQKLNKPIKSKNISEIQHTNTKGQANLLSKDVPLQKYYIVNCHNFFDAFIGSQFMAQTKAILEMTLLQSKIQCSNVNDITLQKC